MKRLAGKIKKINSATRQDHRIKARRRRSRSGWALVGMVGNLKTYEGWVVFIDNFTGVLEGVADGLRQATDQRGICLFCWHFVGEMVVEMTDCGF